MPPHVLVADDDPDIRDLVRLQVERLGFDCTAVADGREALDALESTAFDLAILDVSMPRATGLEVVAQVRAVDPDHELPIVLMSALTAPADVRRGLEIGADDYVTKPTDLADLRARICALLDRD